MSHPEEASQHQGTHSYLRCCPHPHAITFAPPAFYASERDLANVQKPPSAIAGSKSKSYLGYNRICQALRHIAGVVYAAMREAKLKPKEIQLSIMAGKIYISSNFHADKILEALSRSQRPEFKPSWKVGDSKNGERAKRYQRHLQRNFLQGSGGLDRLRNKMHGEIMREEFPKVEWQLSKDEIALQADASLTTIYNVIQDAAGKNRLYKDIIAVHQEDYGEIIDNVPADISVARHAEQNIASLFASSKDFYYHSSLEWLRIKGNMSIIVPFSGRYVPCGVCHAIEREAEKDGGIFSAGDKQFVLQRSGRRAGMLYHDEIQVLAPEMLHCNPSMALIRAENLIERLLSGTNDEAKNTDPGLICEPYATDSDSCDDV
ncbi:hypothetical protein [Paraburkholderia sp. BR10882]|uniref:hypothetical protein n=1 Tax=unclassified Paraburkholderia TaxID=2615204 RepID=UPI0034CE142A